MELNYNWNEVIEVFDRLNLEHYLHNPDYDSYFNANMIDFIDNKCPEGWDIDAGCTKFVLLTPDHYNCIIKIPFNSDGDCEDIYPFENAYYPIADEYGWDYCQSETEYYELATEAGVEDLFAKTEYIGDYCGFPVYAQEKCESISSIRTKENVTVPHSPHFEEAKKAVSDELTHVWFCSVNYLGIMLDTYGFEKVKKFDSFISNYRIHDLHDQNYGYKKSTFIPKLFDFSGYGE